MPLLDQVLFTTLDDAKAQNIKQLDVRELTDVTDTMFICTATSSRHAQSIARKVKEAAIEQCDVRPQSESGQTNGEWVLLDLGDSLVHIMTAEARELYKLEQLWDIANEARQSDG